jgi:hypothetical protein
MGTKEQTSKTNGSRKQVCDRFWSGVSLDVCGRGLRGLPRYIIPLSSARSEPSPRLFQASKRRHAVSSLAGSCSVPNRECPRSLFRRQRDSGRFGSAALSLLLPAPRASQFVRLFRELALNELRHLHPTRLAWPVCYTDKVRCSKRGSK